MTFFTSSTFSRISQNRGFGFYFIVWVLCFLQLDRWKILRHWRLKNYDFFQFIKLFQYCQCYVWNFYFDVINYHVFQNLTKQEFEILLHWMRFYVFWQLDWLKIFWNRRVRHRQEFIENRILIVNFAQSKCSRGFWGCWIHI